MKTLLRFSALMLATNLAFAGVVYHEASGITFGTATGLLSVRPHGITFGTANGITFSTANGITFSTADGLLWGNPVGITFGTADGITFGTANGITFSTANGITFGTANEAGGGELSGLGLALPDGITFGTANTRPSFDLDLIRQLSLPADTSSINVVITYHQPPSREDFDALRAVGIAGGTTLRVLPMVVVNATREQVAKLAELPNVRSVYANRNTSMFADTKTRGRVFADLAETLQETRLQGRAATGSGIGVAILDTGIDSEHPDLAGKLRRNVEVVSSQGSMFGFVQPVISPNVPNSDPVYGHGTFVAGIVGGSGSASGGAVRGLAGGAHLVGVGAGDLALISILEGFDAILALADEDNIRVVNCSFGVDGLFDPDDPVNIATKTLFHRGITVVMAAGNDGPRPGSLSPYSVAPWVIGVAGLAGDREVASFSSRGFFASMLYAPTISAPATGIVSLRARGTLLAGSAAGDLATTSYDPELYSSGSGTSFATPIISALVARMYELRPSITPREIKAILQNTATSNPAYDRSAVGAGAVNFVAALHKTIRPEIEYGTLLKDRFYQSDYHYSPLASSSITRPVPAQSYVRSEAFDVAVGTAGLHVALGWGPQPTVRDLDLALVAPDGKRHASRRINSLGLFGTTEAIEIQEPLPGRWTAEVSTKITSAEAGTFTLAFEAYVATYRTLASFSGTDSLAMQRFIRSGVMSGSTKLDGSERVDRGTLARALVAYGQPRFAPDTASFSDTKSFARIYIESVAGKQSLGSRLLDTTTSSFRQSDVASRLDLARALVRFAGLEAEAKSLEGSLVGVSDESTIGSADKGFVAIALREGFLDRRGTKAEVDAPLTTLTLARGLYAVR